MFLPANKTAIYTGGLYGANAGIALMNAAKTTVLTFITAGATAFKNTVTIPAATVDRYIRASFLNVNDYGTVLPFSITYSVSPEVWHVARVEDFNALKNTVETKLVRPAKAGDTITYQYSDFVWADGAYDINGNVVGSGRWKHATAGKPVLAGATAIFTGAWLGQSAGCLISNSAGQIVQLVTSPNPATGANDFVTEITVQLHPEAATFRPSIYTGSGINDFTAYITTVVEEKYFVAKNEELDAFIGFFIMNISADYNYKRRVNTHSRTPRSGFLNDAYFSVESGTIFGLADVLKGDIIYWNGTTWAKKTYRLNLAEGGGGGGGGIPEITDYDVIIVGGGAGGVGAAYALKNTGLRVLLIEKDASLGGTHLNAWVNVYATTPPPPYLKSVIETLIATGKARYINSEYEEFTSEELANITYDNTYLRYEFTGKPEACVTLDIEGTAAKYLADISTGVTVILGATMTSVNYEGEYVKGITYTKAGVTTTVTSKYFIDSTADDNLIAMIGGERLQGEEATTKFQAEYGFTEARGTTNSSTVCNAPTMMYRTIVGTEDLSGIIAAFNNDAAAYYSPDKTKIYFNTVSFLSNAGYEVVRDGSEAVRLIMSPKTIQHWKTVKNGGAARFATLNLPARKFEANAPRLGVRETWRLKAERLLNENSFYTQISVDNIKIGNNLDKKIACANHIVDIHGTSNITTANKAAMNAARRPYGVP